MVGTGKDGRVLKEDMLKHVDMLNAGVAPPAPGEWFLFSSFQNYVTHLSVHNIKCDCVTEFHATYLASSHRRLILVLSDIPS